MKKHQLSIAAGINIHAAGFQNSVAKAGFSGLMTEFEYLGCHAEDEKTNAVLNSINRCSSNPKLRMSPSLNMTNVM